MKRAVHFKTLNSVLLIGAITASLALPPTVGGQQGKRVPVTLAKCWEYVPESTADVRAAADASNIYFAEEGGRVTAVSISSGKRHWSADLGGAALSNIIANGDRVIVVTGVGPDGGRTTAARLRALSASTGVTILDKQIEFNGRLSLNYLDGRIVLVAENGVVSALAAATGETQWSKTMGTISLAAVRAVGTEIMFTTAEDHRLRILDVSDGREVASVDTGHAVTALSTVGDDLIWGDERGSVVRYDRGEGAISWRYRNGARISSIVVAGDHVIATSLDNFIYSIADSTGRVRWKKRLPARVLDRPLVDNELGIVLTFGEPDAALINMENGKVLGQYSVNDDESFMQPPIAASGSYIFFTNRRVLLQRRGECPK